MLVEGFKRDAFPKLEIYRAENGKPLLHPGRSAHRRYRADTPLPQARVPVIDLDDIEAIADICSKRCRCDVAAPRDAERVMAQLTDDCFAFSGPLLPIDAMPSA